MSHSSTSSSLLQQHRPSSLSPQPFLPTQEQKQCQVVRKQLESHDRPSRPNKSCDQLNQPDVAVTVSRTSSCLSVRSSRSMAPVASTSSGKSYLNMEPTSSTSRDQASPEVSLANKSSSKLQAFANNALGEAMPRQQWQPDEDSALCTFPLCSVVFGPPSYFSTGPRRHHCRLCGLLFCADHSARRAPLLTTDFMGSQVVAAQRVCDMCLGKTDATEELGRRNSGESSSSISDPSDFLVTPSSEYTSSSASQSGDVDRAIVEVEPMVTPPIQDWMGRDGVLSLYPLAAASSHSPSAVAPSAAPLFGPSLAARRNARLREAARLSVRQRRMGKENGFLLPNRSTPSSRRNSIEEGSDEEREAIKGHMIEDGPIRYRAPGFKSPEGSGSRTPSEERIKQSTF